MAPLDDAEEADPWAHWPLRPQALSLVCVVCGLPSVSLDSRLCMSVGTGVVDASAACCARTLIKEPHVGGWGR